MRIRSYKFGEMFGIFKILNENLNILSKLIMILIFKY